MSIVNVNNVREWCKKWHYCSINATMASIVNETALLLYKWYNDVNRECQQCVGLVKKWHYYFKNGTMVSILNVNNAWNWWKTTLLLHKWYDGVDLGCNIRTTLQMVNGVHLEWKTITTVRIVQRRQSRMPVICEIGGKMASLSYK